MSPHQATPRDCKPALLATAGNIARSVARSHNNGARHRPAPEVSEATGADIEHMGLERGHRTLVITRKGGKVVTIPLAPRTARAEDLAIGERTEGPLFLAGDGRRLDRHGAARIVRRVTRRAGITKQVGPHTLRHAFITAALDAGVPLRDVQEAHPTPTRAPLCAMTAPAPASTGMPPTSSPPTSPEQPDNPGSQSGRRQRPDWPRTEPHLRSPGVAAGNEPEPPFWAVSKERVKLSACRS